MAINLADRNPLDARPERPDLWHDASPGGRARTATRKAGVGVILGLSAMLGASGCSKGGAPDLNGCPKLSDPAPGDPMGPPSRSLYVELRTPTGTRLTIPLDGSGGTYSGSHIFDQCDEQGTYSVDKVVLVDINGDPVATANRNGTSYNVAYQGGQMTTVSGSSFGNIASTYSAPATGAVMIQSLTASTATARQGDPITVQVAVSGDPCGVRESQWWLAPASVGMMTTPAQAIPGGSGSVTLRVPPTADPTTYFIEGQVTLKSGGRIFGVVRKLATDTTYSLLDKSTGVYMPTPVMAATVTVSANPDADKVAPQVISVDASPANPVRCGTENLTVHLSDDKGLPAGQKVKIWLGTLENPKLTSAMVTGSEYMYGTFQIPLDAPSGPWYAWPEVVLDAAGNAAQASFAGGKFTLSGPGITMAQPITAGTFIVPSNTVPRPDLGVQPADLGVPPDMAMPLPAVLNAITVMPSSITMPGAPLTVTVSWTDNAQILK